MVSGLAGEGGPSRPGRHGPDLAGLAVFTLDPAGRIATWSVTAERLLGQPAGAVSGRDAAAVLRPGPGQGDLLAQALAAVAAGQTWSGTLDVTAGDGRYQLGLHCEPMAGGGALMIARPVPLRPGAELLREAAARIGSTLDPARTAREFTEVAVPAFADAAAVFVSERLLAAEEPAARDPGPAAVVRRLAARLAGQSQSVTGSLLRPGEVLVFSTGSPSYQAMSTGQPVLSDHLDPETEQRLAGRPGGRDVAGGYTSFVAVPLVARDVLLGCLTLARLAGTPRFGPDDITLAGELAARTAVCIDNARLYDRERRTAFALQRGLVPAEPRVPAGLEVAHRSLPAGTSVVGGDWHDIVALPGGRAAVIVGDAMGHGAEAAAVMVQLRTAAHELAALGQPPTDVLRRLDRLAAGMPGTPYATCVCVLIDPAAGSCLAARAGHPPPVLALPDGQTRVPALPSGLPLGLGASPFEAARFELPAGAVLACYTDGLAENRSRPPGDGLAALQAALSSALAEPGSTLDSCCGSVTHALRQRGDDDITLVLARIR